MFHTHPDTVWSLSTFDYEQLLRDAARERIAASAQAGRPSPLTSLRAARLAVGTWFGGIVPRVLGAKQTPASPPWSSI